jgi:hypothetical protein
VQANMVLTGRASKHVLMVLKVSNYIMNKVLEQTLYLLLINMFHGLLPMVNTLKLNKMLSKQTWSNSSVQTIKVQLKLLLAHDNSKNRQNNR